MKDTGKTALLIENESIWVERLSTLLQDMGITQIEVLKSYTEAEKALRNLDLSLFTFAVVDIRMRRQIFDQGGLALLDIIKERKPNKPVLMLTAYSHDYPGLARVTSRYRNVMAYDKEAFESSARVIVESLLKGLPQQIGEQSEELQVSHPQAPDDHTYPKFWGRTNTFRLIYSICGLFMGLVCIIGGIILLLNGVTGSTNWTAKLLGAETDISDAAPGTVLFIVGLFVIWISRYTVKVKK